MDPRDPTQRPSIFSTPESDDERRPPDPPRHTERPGDPTIVGRPYRADSQAPPPYDPLFPARPYASEYPAEPPANRRLLIALGIGGLLLLLIGGFVARSILSPQDEAALAASPSMTATATALPSSSSEESAGPSTAPSEPASTAPTPAPTPAGPPQEVAVGGWASVATDGLNVRSAAGADAASNHVLVRGAAMHVSEGPKVVGGLNWYRIASLGGAVGWVSSGWVAEPYMTTLVEDPVLIRCGEVGRPVFDVVDGSLVAHDPLAIGDLAVPAAAFSDVALGAIELLRAVGEEACFSAEIGSDGTPSISAQLTAGACGQATEDGNFFRLRPATGQDASVQEQVKNPAVVHPAVLTGGPSGDRQATNLRSVVSFIAAGKATGCIRVTVREDAGGVDADRSAETTQCSLVHEHNIDSIRLSPASGGATTWIKLTRGNSEPGAFPLETPVEAYVGASASNDGHGAWAWPGGDDCS